MNTFIVIFFVIVIGAGYLLCGKLVDMIMVDQFHYENPLWKLPIITLWPFALTYLLGTFVAAWVISVIDYYKSKEG